MKNNKFFFGFVVVFVVLFVFFAFFFGFKVVRTQFQPGKVSRLVKSNVHYSMVVTRVDGVSVKPVVASTVPALGLVGVVANNQVHRVVQVENVKTVAGVRGVLNAVATVGKVVANQV